MSGKTDTKTVKSGSNNSEKGEEMKGYDFINVSQKVAQVGDSLTMPINKVVYNSEKQLITIVGDNNEAVCLNIQQHENSKYKSVTGGRRFLNAVNRAMGWQHSTVENAVSTVNSMNLSLNIEMKEMNNGFAGRLYKVI